MPPPGCDDAHVFLNWWARMLEEGVYQTRAALARAEGVSRAAVTQALRRLTLGSP